MLYIVLFLHQTTTINGDGGKLVPLYIVLFLHQTTTKKRSCIFRSCCISYYSYIKPQLLGCKNYRVSCCISYYSYIKPQPAGGAIGSLFVVYRTIPTSNHNTYTVNVVTGVLYIVLFLHQTTT